MAMLFSYVVRRLNVIRVMPGNEPMSLRSKLMWLRQKRRRLPRFPIRTIKFWR